MSFVQQGAVCWNYWIECTNKPADGTCKGKRTKTKTTTIKQQQQQTSSPTITPPPYQQQQTNNNKNNNKQACKP